MMIQFNGDDSSHFDDGGDSSRFNASVSMAVFCNNSKQL